MNRETPLGSEPDDEKPASGESIGPQVGDEAETASEVLPPTSSQIGSGGDSFGELFGLDKQLEDRGRPDPLIGVTLGDVRIVRLIGQGGMGRVYEGFQERLSRVVAVKVLRPGFVTPEMQYRFKVEAEILARLQHPGIAQIYAAGMHDLDGASVPYFVMELIAGARPLTHYATEMELSTKDRLTLFQGVCDAVAHGHQKGVIHRDLKPSNILVDTHGQSKVIDFGVAKATNSDLALTTMRTEVGQIIGTLQYMAPEQIEGNPADIDVRCDVYALGIVLYELLTGRLPYDVRNKAIHEAMQMVRETEPLPISAFDRMLRGDLAVIAAKCLEKDRGSRYAAASEVGGDLSRHLAGEPIAAKPASLWHSVQRLGRKHKAAAVAVAGIALSLVAAVIVSLKFAFWAEAARNRADKERARAEASLQSAEASGRIVRRQLYKRNLAEMVRLASEEHWDEASKVYHELLSDLEGSHVPIELRCLGATVGGQSLRFQDQAQAVREVVFSPCGKLAATVTNFDDIQVWSLATGKAISRLSCEEGSRPKSVRFCSRSITLTDGYRLWDVASGEQLNVSSGKICRWSAVSPDGRRMITHGARSCSSMDGRRTPRDPYRIREDLELWDTQTGERIACLLTGFSGGAFAEAFMNGLTIHRPELQPESTVADDEPQFSSWISSLFDPWLHFFSPDGKRVILFVGSWDPYLWDLQEGKLIARLANCRLSRDRQREAGAFDHFRPFSPDGAWIVLPCEDGEAHVWDAATGRLAARLENVDSLPVFSPTSEHVAAQHPTLRWWSCGDWALRGTVQHQVDGFFFSPDGSFVAANGGLGEPTTVWDVKGGKPAFALEQIGGGRWLEVKAFAAYANDGVFDSVVVKEEGFQEDGVQERGVKEVVQVWTMAGELVQSLGAAHSVDGVFMSHEGRFLAMTDGGRRILLQDLRSVSRAGPTIFSAAVRSEGMFSADNKWFSDGSHVWPVEPNGTTHFGFDSLQLDEFYGINQDGSLVADRDSLLDTSTGTAVLHGRFHVSGSVEKPMQIALTPIVTARLFDVLSGQQLSLLNDLGGWGSTRVELSADGNSLITASRTGVVRLMDMASGKTIDTKHMKHGIHAVAAGPGGLLAVARGGTVYWGKAYENGSNLEELQLAPPSSDSKTITNLAFSADGSMLFVATDADGSVRGVALKSAKVIHSWQMKPSEQGSGALRLSFSNDAKRCAILYAGQISVRDIGTGQEVLNELFHHADGDVRASRLALDATGARVAVSRRGGPTSEIGLCSVDGRKSLLKPLSLPFRVGDLALLPDGSRFFVGTDWRVRSFDFKTLRIARDIVGAGRVFMIRCSGDGRRIAVVSKDMVHGLRDCLKPDARLAAPGIGSPGTFSPDGSRYATATHLWDLASGQELVAINWSDNRHAWSPHEWSADSSLLATLGEGNRVVVWDARAGRRKAVCRGHTGPIRQLRFSQNGTLLASVQALRERYDYWTSEILLWTSCSGTIVARFREETRCVKDVRLSPDGSRMVSIPEIEPHCSRHASLWDVSSKKVIAELNGPGPHSDTFSAAFSVDGSRVVTGHSSGLVRFWDASDGTYLCEIDTESQEPVKALVLSPDGKRVFIGPGPRGGTTVLGVSKAEIALARIAADAIEARMKERVDEWVAAGPEAARASLEAVKRDLPPEEYRVVRNMVLTALVSAPARKP